MEARISGVIQRLGLLPANKILAGFRQCLAGFLESDLSLEAHRHLHRLKPEKKDLNPSPFYQKGRPLSSRIRLHQRPIKGALLTAFLKRSNREDVKISLVRVFSTQSSLQTGERCASRECIPTCGYSVKT